MRLFIALLVSKTYIFFTNIFCKKKSDRVGLLAARICPNILYKIKKEELDEKTIVTEISSEEIRSYIEQNRAY